MMKRIILCSLVLCTPVLAGDSMRMRVHPEESHAQYLTSNLMACGSDGLVVAVIQDSHGAGLLRYSVLEGTRELCKLMVKATPFDHDELKKDIIP